MKKWATIPLVVILSCLWFGCSSDDDSDDPAPTTTTDTTPTAVSATFTSAGCGTCHGADGSGGTAANTNLHTYTDGVEEATYIALVRAGKDGTTMAAFDTTKYPDADAQNDYAFFKAQ